MFRVLDLVDHSPNFHRVLHAGDRNRSQVGGVKMLAVLSERHVRPAADENVVLRELFVEPVDARR